jgi:hypothetical protein
MAWTCQRQSAGVPCRHLNPNRKRNCEACGKTRPPRKRPAHLAALETDYADFIALNGGEFCAICKRPPSQARRLDRDHCHKTGEATGLALRPLQPQRCRPGSTPTGCAEPPPISTARPDIIHDLFLRSPRESGGFVVLGSDVRRRKFAICATFDAPPPRRVIPNGPLVSIVTGLTRPAAGLSANPRTLWQGRHHA